MRMPGVLVGVAVSALALLLPAEAAAAAPVTTTPVVPAVSAECDPLGPAYDPFACSDGWQPAFNQYTNDLPTYVTGPTTFSVTVAGPDPVCRMEYNDQVRTSAPWTFTSVDPGGGSWSSEITITLCDGRVDASSAWATSAFEVDRTVLSAGRVTRTVRLRNNTDVAATAQLLSASGRALTTTSLPPSSQATVQVPSRVRRTTPYTLRITDGAALTQTVRLVVAVGWTVMLTVPDPAAYEQCQVVQWAYRPAGRPRHTTDASLVKDIRGALRRLATRTNLTFRRTQDFESARLRFSWRNQGTGGPSAVGSTDGSVSLNSADIWPSDSYRGFGRYANGPAGRGWLLVHETMHTMGFGHVNSRTSIMGPVNYGQNRFTAGDRAGLRTLYPKSAC